MKIKSGLAFHCYDGKLYEFVYNYDERVEWIKISKRQEEQELSLRLLKMIPLKLVPGREDKEYQTLINASEIVRKTGKACAKAWERYKEVWKSCSESWVIYGEAGKALDEARKVSKKIVKVGEVCGKTREARNKAWGNYGRAWEAYNNKWGTKIVSLHEELCPNCPWNGQTIFPS